MQTLCQTLERRLRPAKQQERPYFIDQAGGSAGLCQAIWTVSVRGLGRVPVLLAISGVQAKEQTQPGAIAVDDNSVYWVNTSEGTVMKVTPK